MLHFFRIFCCLLFFTLCATLPSAEAAEKDSHPTLRIGCILPDSTIPNIFANRQYYTIFIDELTKFTFWDCEAVFLPTDQAITMLKTGEVDLLLPVERLEKETEDIIYTKIDLGTDIIGLYTLPDNEAFHPDDLGTLQGASIGLLENRTANRVLDAFEQDNRLNLQRHYFPTKESMMDALSSHSIDLILDVATNIRGNARYLLSLDTCPIYAAALPSAAEKLRAIDNAARAMMKENPHFRLFRYNSISSQLQSEITHFTPSETATIHGMEPLRIVIFNEDAPYVYYEGKDQKLSGIYPDILLAIAKDSDLSFRFLRAYSYDEAQAMLRDGRADLMLDVYTNAKESHDLRFTAPLYLAKFSFIGNQRKNTDWQNPSTLVLPSMHPSLRRFTEKMLPDTELLLQPTAITALAALDQEQADAALIDTLQLQMERPIIPYPNLAVIPTESLNVPISLAIAPHQSSSLPTILNKAILRLPPHVVEQIILKHTMNENPHLTFSHLMYYYPLQCGIAFGMFLLILAVLTVFYHHNRQIAREQKKLEERNIVLLDAIESIQIANDDRDNYKQMAETDPLTGLLNKEGIQREARLLFDKVPAEGRCHALLVTDLDHFKKANDIAGHQFGDTILREYAAILKQILRSEDRAGRFGGDEFIILLKNVRPGDVSHIAQRINKATREIPRAEGNPAISASIGIALFPEHGESYDTLFRAADYALYNVKKDGRDNYAIASKI